LFNILYKQIIFSHTFLPFLGFKISHLVWVILYTFGSVFSEPETYRFYFIWYESAKGVKKYP